MRPAERQRQCPTSAQAVAPITPEQVWAARGLLRWSRERLSSESDVPYGFIVKFERLGHIAPVFSRERGFNGLSAIRLAFERRGVTFTGRMGAFMRAVAFIASLLFATGAAEAREPQPGSRFGFYHSTDGEQVHKPT